MKYSFKESRVKCQDPRECRPQRKQKTLTTSTDKLFDYMFAQSSKLTDQLAGVREELRLQREQADRHHKDLKSSLARMEELAIAAERRADAEAKRAAMETEAREKAEEQVADLIRLYRRLKDKESSFNDKNEKTQGWQTNIYH